VDPLIEQTHGDRRWSPTGDHGEWARTTRQSVFEAARRCVSHAMYASLRGDMHPHELHASDVVFRELHVCVQAYSRALSALGQPEESSVGLIVAAARQASEPDDLHPSIVSAIEQWCREAHTSEA
jgi:hypothetical protein